MCCEIPSFSQHPEIGWQIRGSTLDHNQDVKDLVAAPRQGATALYDPFVHIQVGVMGHYVDPAERG